MEAYSQADPLMTMLLAGLCNGYMRDERCDFTVADHCHNPAA